MSWKKWNFLVYLSGIQKAFERGPSSFLESLEEELAIEYGNLLKYEELYWHQKSRAMWFVEGERNTKFFHASALIKQWKRLVSFICDINSNWVIRLFLPY